jgi:hypothetical protein
VRQRTARLAEVQALVAAGAMEEAAGQRVLDEHEAELRRRDPDLAIGWARQWPHAPIEPRPVALGAREERGIRVRYAVFAPDATEIAVAVRGAPLPADLRVAGAPAGFRGGSSADGWEGVLHCHATLDPLSRAIEIDGVRVPLVTPAPCAEVRVEALPPEDPALRHLRHVAALAGRHPLDEPHLEAAIAALVGAGAVAADEPQLEAIRAVASARQRRRAAAKPSARGPARTIAVGAVTPLFDGVAVAVDALESTAEDWTIRIEFAPEGASPRPYEAPTARSARLVWWAEDDRGTRYLAEPDGLGGNAHRGRGQLRFAAPLDPRARWVELRPTTETSQAVIRIPLRPPID